LANIGRVVLPIFADICHISRPIGIKRSLFNKPKQCNQQRFQYTQLEMS
jgi:hypothetical protein